MHAPLKAVALLLAVAGPVVLLRHDSAAPPARAAARISPELKGLIWKCPGHGADTLPQIPGVGEITNVPEFHDCQRFTDDADTKYDSMYAIFALNDADTRLRSLKFLECTGTFQVMTGSAAAILSGDVLQSAPVTQVSNLNGVPVSPYYVESVPAPRSAAVNDPNFTQPGDCRRNAGIKWNEVALTFAVVLSWGGTYENLNLRPGYNCLYLFDSARLRGFVRPVGDHAEKCLERLDPTTLTNADLLPVRATIRHRLSRGDYPGVARWERDRATKAYFMGVKCGAAWCEVGSKPRVRDGGLVQPTYARQYVSSSSNVLEQRVVEVQGWYDEQQLANPPAGAGELPVPSGVMGRMIPHAKLGSYLEASVESAWRRAAQIWIASALPKYRSGSNLDPPSLGRVYNQTFLCTGACPIPKGVTAPKCPELTPPETRFYLKIVSTVAGTPPMVVCATEWHHEFTTPRPIPGTVRWAWYDKDEGGWYRCPAGCCFPD